jgi:hypothetical protein
MESRRLPIVLANHGLGNGSAFIGRGNAALVRKEKNAKIAKRRAKPQAAFGGVATLAVRVTV